MVDTLNGINVPKEAIVTGWAASMGSIIACACDKVFMHKSAWMVIHNPWTCVQGDAKELRKLADVLDKMCESGLDIYQRHTGKSREEVAKLLDAETWIRGVDASAAGWNFELVEDTKNNNGEENMKFNLLGKLNFRHVPAAVLAMADGNPAAPPAASGATPPPMDVEKLLADIKQERDTLVAQLATVKGNAEQAVIDAKAAFDKAQTDHAAALAVKETELANASKGLESVKAELTAKVEALAKAETEKTDLAAQVAKLSPGLSMPEGGAEPSDWKAAMAACGGDYVKARKQYAALYKQMREQAKK
jgi:hypothetical protein